MSIKKTEKSVEWISKSASIILFAVSVLLCLSGEVIAEQGAGIAPPQAEIDLEGALVHYEIQVPIKNDGKTPSSPVTTVSVWPGGWDVDGLIPVVYAPDGSLRAVSTLWERQDEPVRVLFDTSFAPDANEETDNSIYYLYLWEEDVIPDQPEWDRKHGFTLETKNFGTEYLDDFDHSDIDDFIKLWNQAPESHGRSLVQKVQHGYHMHRNYGPTPLEYLANQGAPLSLNRYVGYFEVEQADKSAIDDFDEERRELEKKVPKLKAELEDLNKKVEEAEAALQEAKDAEDESEISNRRTAFEEWRVRRDKLEKQTLEEAEWRLEYVTAAISEIENNTHTFYAASDGASWLLVNGREITGWPADQEVPRRRGRYYGYEEGAINLEPGVHRVEFLYAATGEDYLALMLWRKPGQEEEDIMEPEMFTDVAEAAVRNSNMDGGRHPVAWQITEESRIPGSPDLIFVDFSVPAIGENDDLTYRWKLGDGGVAEGKDIRHLYLHTGRYDVKLEAYEKDEGDDALWTVEQTVHIHVPHGAHKLADTRDIERAIVDKDLTDYPISHVINALEAVEEYDPDRLYYNDWRSHLVFNLSDRAEELAEKSIDWTLEIGDICMEPLIGHYSGALLCYQAAARELKEGSPAWHRAMLRKARAKVLAYGLGDEVIEMMGTIKKHRDPVDEEHIVGWWTFDGIKSGNSVIPDFSSNEMYGEIENPRGFEPVEDDDLGLVGSFKGFGALARLKVSEEPAHPTVAISLRLKLTERPRGTQYIVSGKNFSLTLQNGKPVLECFKDFFTAEANEALKEGHWYNLLLVRDAGNDTVLYVDGRDELLHFIQGRSPYVDTLFVGASESGEESLSALISDVRVYDKVLSERERIELLLDYEWNRTWTKALLSADKASEAISFVEQWTGRLEESEPVEAVMRQASRERARSLMRRGGDADLLEAMEMLYDLLIEDPARFVSPAFNIMMLDMYLGREAYSVAYHQAERILNIQMSSTHKAEVLSRLVISLCGMGEAEKARKAFEELETEFPYSQGLRDARRALEELENSL